MHIIERMLAAIVLTTVSAAVAASLYARHEHNRAIALQDQVSQVERERDGYIRSQDAMQRSEIKARHHHTVSTTRLSKAVQEHHVVAATIVPDVIWDTIYGTDNAGS